MNLPQIVMPIIVSSTIKFNLGIKNKKKKKKKKEKENEKLVLSNTFLSAQYPNSCILS